MIPTPPPAPRPARPAAARRAGFALITVLALLGVLALLLAAMVLTSSVEISATESSVNASTGFFSAEAGLNLRGDAIAQTFQGYSVPSGVGPDPAADPCSSGNEGSGDFACRSNRLNGRDVVTYTLEDAGNAAGGGRLITVPASETFGGLVAFENRYTVVSEAVNDRTERPEAILEMVFRSRLVPIFQFAAFYDKDLEILPGPTMNLNGRVHVNGDLYLNSGDTLAIGGAITVARRDAPVAGDDGGRLLRQRKNVDGGCGGTVRVNDLDGSTSPDPAIPCSGPVAQSDLDTWNGQIETDLDYLQVPDPQSFEVGDFYWDNADLRVVLDVASSPPSIYASSGVDGVGRPLADAVASNELDLCAAPAGPVPFTPGSGAGAQVPLDWSQSFFDNREGNAIRMLEVDVRELLRCLHDRRALLLGGEGIDTTDQGGLVLYLTVTGADRNRVNDYGVRLRNGGRLASSDPGHPQIEGLTVVTDQAVYIEGDYNCNGACGVASSGTANWRPASFIADSLNILSSAWSSDGASTLGLGDRAAASSEINAAFLSGTDVTGGSEGGSGRGAGAYNGGLENYPRFHENWSGDTLTYRGSLVSFDAPQHVDGGWRYGDPVYTAPNRNWDYEQRFNDPTQLPPLSPRFVYLRQELFVREFEQ